MRFIHLTDMHITADDQPLYGLSPSRRLEAAITCINQEFKDIAFVMMTGDLVNKGTTEEYKALRDLLKKLKAPYYLLVGNHDNRSEFCQAFPNVQVDPNGFIQYTFKVEGNLFIVIDTLDPGKVTGLLCKPRLDWLENEIKSAAGHDTFLFLHHPPLRLEGSDALSDIIGEGRIKHMFFGHVHRTLHGSWRGIPMSSQHSTIHQFVYTFGSSLMQGCHEPPTFAAVNLFNGNVVINPHSYLDDSPRFNVRNKAAINAASPQELPPVV